jgi:hypothetical protein
MAAAWDKAGDGAQDIVEMGGEGHLGDIPGDRRAGALTAVIERDAPPSGERRDHRQPRCGRDQQPAQEEDGGAPPGTFKGSEMPPVWAIDQDLAHAHGPTRGIIPSIHA